ncbi:MAG: ketoacyl-ACP synthase III [Terracidiphilus sp.]|jgi:3-oxoacyl-[acyl-carrier-protein] synthase-3
MAYLRAFGSWLPRRRVSNEEIAPLVNATPEWILEVSGIAERRYADDSDTVTGVGLLAARDCLEKAGATATDLGMILVASGSSDRFCPGPACEIAAGLGLSSTAALDIPVSSAGSLIGLVLAAQLAPNMGPVLVVGAEIMSRRITLDPEGKNSAILFGDGAGAVLVDADNGFARITDSCLFTDGASAETIFVHDGKFSMDGQAVIMQASRKIPRAINQLLAQNQVSASDVEVFLLHQANLNLITRVAATLKAPRERFYTNIDRYGNTSSASLLIAADEWYAKQTAAISGPLVFSAFGSGLNWGALLAVPIRDRQATS